MSLTSQKVENGIGTVQFTGATKLNCLTGELMRDIMAQLDTLDKEGARVMVIRAQPDAPVWSAGHDINELPEPRRDALSYSDPLETLLRHVQECPVPVIAMVQGSVWGGACDLCCSCDIVVASDTAIFAMTPAKVGIPYHASGLVHFLNHISVNKAKEMFFTGDPTPATDAHIHGFVNHVVPAGELEKFTYALAARIAKNAPLAVRALKAELRLLTRGPLIDTETGERIESIRRRVYDSADYEEGLRAFKEKRAPHFHGR